MFKFIVLIIFLCCKQNFLLIKLIWFTYALYYNYLNFQLLLLHPYTWQLSLLFLFFYVTLYFAVREILLCKHVPMNSINLMLFIWVNSFLCPYIIAICHNKFNISVLGIRHVFAYISVVCQGKINCCFSQIFQHSEYSTFWQYISMRI